MNHVKRDAIINAWRSSIEAVAKNGGVIPEYMLVQIEYFVNHTCDNECTCTLEPPLDGFCLLNTAQHHQD